MDRTVLIEEGRIALIEGNQMVQIADLFVARDTELVGMATRPVEVLLGEAYEGTKVVLVARPLVEDGTDKDRAIDECPRGVARRSLLEEERGIGTPTDVGAGDSSLGDWAGLGLVDLEVGAVL